MPFEAHLEYIFHITCGNCKFYWSYASMNKSFRIDKKPYYCPNCGEKDKIILQEEI